MGNAIAAQAAAIAEEQRQIAAYTAQRADQYHLAMWRQTADGQQYLAWCEQAVPVLALLRVLNGMWQQGWIDAVEAILGHPIRVATLLLASRPLSRAVVIGGAGLLALGWITETDALCVMGLLVASTVGVAKILQQNRLNVAKAERTAIFGFDPLDSSALPPWTANNAQGFTSFTLTAAISGWLQDGGKGFPTLAQLPHLGDLHIAPQYLPEPMYGTYAAMMEAANQS